MTPEEVRMFLGKRIRALRKTRGWTQEELAEHAELSHKYIGEVERGEVNPSLDTLLSIANALKVEIPKLFSSDCQAPGLFSSGCAKFIFQFSDQRASC